MYELPEKYTRTKADLTLSVYTIKLCCTNNYTVDHLPSGSCM